jgi:hypothetical protein
VLPAKKPVSVSGYEVVNPIAQKRGYPSEKVKPTPPFEMAGHPKGGRASGVQHSVLNQHDGIQMPGYLKTLELFAGKIALQGRKMKMAGRVVSNNELYRAVAEITNTVK